MRFLGSTYIRPSVDIVKRWNIEIAVDFVTKGFRPNVVLELFHTRFWRYQMTVIKILFMHGVFD